MRLSVTSAMAGLWLLAPMGAAAQEAPAHPSPPRAEAVAPGVWLIQGLRTPGRQPDGNTVIWQAPEGLVVMDTGRHAWHQQAIEDFAAGRHAPVVAIVNSHWHLDHVSGNPVLKRDWPRARVYASAAIDEAIGGFLARSAADGRKHLDDRSLPPETIEDLRRDLATTEAADKLKPDVTVRASAGHVLGGRRLRLNLAKDAATAGDVWVYDAKARVAAVGDLVTLPVPYLDTACPKGWSAALDQVWAGPFETVIPGHGRPMTRAQFDMYRQAFRAFVDCAASARPTADCGADWARQVKPLLQANGMNVQRAGPYAAYYAGEVLRAHGGRSASCKAA